MVICDPSYALSIPNKLKKIGQSIRWIWLLDHPIPNTDKVPSWQIIIPQMQVNRKNDIYIALISGTHSVCPNGIYICIISTMVETS